MKERTKISLLELDRLLDVESDRWERNKQRVLRDLRTRDVAVEIPTPECVDVTTSGRSWTELYREQVRRLPRMDRAEEFRMARRYEVLRERLVDALQRVGFVGDQVMEQVVGRALPVPAKAKRSAVEYLERCRSEFEALRNLYVERSLHLVFHKVHRYRGLGVDTIDLVQEANASLFQAIEGFDWRRDVRFNTYAQYWIHQAILKALYDASRTVRLPVWIQKAHRKIQQIRDEAFHATGEWPSNEAVASEVDTTAERVEEILASRRGTVSLDRPAFDDDSTSIGQTVVDERVQPIELRVPLESDLGESLEAALESLDERERMVVRRRFGLGDAEPETLAEIAADLGVSAERVRQIQNHALEQLQRPAVRRALQAFFD